MYMYIGKQAVIVISGSMCWCKEIYKHTAVSRIGLLRSCMGWGVFGVNKVCLYFRNFSENSVKIIFVRKKLRSKEGRHF